MLVKWYNPNHWDFPWNFLEHLSWSEHFTSSIGTPLFMTNSSTSFHFHPLIQIFYIVLYIEFILSQNLSHSLSSSFLYVSGSISLNFMDVKFWARCTLCIFFIKCEVGGISLSLSWMCWKDPWANALDRSNFTLCSTNFWSQVGGLFKQKGQNQG